MEINEIEVPLKSFTVVTFECKIRVEKTIRISDTEYAIQGRCSKPSSNAGIEWVPCEVIMKLSENRIWYADSMTLNPDSESGY